MLKTIQKIKIGLSVTFQSAFSTDRFSSVCIENKFILFLAQSIA